MTDPMERAREVLDGDEGVPGIRPAVTYADHSYPAYSRQQMLDFAVKIAAEQRAAGRDEAAKVADDLARVAARAKDQPQPLPCDTAEAWRRVEDAALDIAAAIRALGDRRAVK